MANQYGIWSFLRLEGSPSWIRVVRGTASGWKREDGSTAYSLSLCCCCLFTLFTVIGLAVSLLAAVEAVAGGDEMDGDDDDDVPDEGFNAW